MDGFVLAGGRSTRMGLDKARLPARLDGEWWPLAVRVRRVLRDAGVARVAIVRRGLADGLPWTDPREGPVEVLREPDDGPAHPLWGVTAALGVAAGEALVVTCDLPWLTVGAVRALIDAEPPAVAWDGERVHPLVGRLPASWAPRAAAAAAAGGRARDLVAACALVRVPPHALRNANRPSDLGEGPMEGIARRFGFLPSGPWAALVDGERERLRQRGVLAPPIVAQTTNAPWS